MLQKPILYFKPVDALKPFHQLLVSSEIFEMYEDMEIFSDYELDIEIPNYFSLVPSDDIILGPQVKAPIFRKIKYFIVNSPKFSFCLNYVINLKNKNDQILSKYVILIIENDIQAYTNEELSEFLDLITNNEIQIMKFLDFHDLKDYFILMHSCFFQKKKEIENVHKELYLASEKEFIDIFQNLFNKE